MLQSVIQILSKLSIAKKASFILDSTGEIGSLKSGERGAGVGRGESGEGAGARR